MAASVELTPFSQLVLWVVFFCMFASFCTFFVYYRAATPGKRIFHMYSTTIVGFASTAYLFMALGYGAVMVDGRIFHYARYLDWLFTTPLLLLDLAGLCNIDTESQAMLVFLDILMVLAGLGGGVTTGAASLFLWLLGCIFFLPIVYDLLFTFREKANSVGAAAASVYNKLMVLTVLLWTAYPVVFFFAEYANILSTTFEVLCYAVLDVTAKCIFGFILLSSRDGMEQALSGYDSIA